MGSRRRAYSKKDYGLESAQRHIAEAHEFSAEVGHSDEVLKEVFFSLSGKPLDDLFKEYGERYSDQAEAYARETLPRWRNHWQRRRAGAYHKWRPDERQMSGMIAARLFDLLPPLLSTPQKHKIVEAIWRAYCPRSQKYIYLGPDSDAEAVVGAVERYFAQQTVLYGIPKKLEQRFDWLASNDVAVKQQLLNHFMNEQRKAAIASARLNVPMMLERLRHDEARSILKLTHTIFLGNHRVELRADPLRIGFILSDSPTDAIKPPWKFSPLGALGVLAAVVIGFVVVSNLLRGTPNPLPVRQTSESVQQVQPVAQQPAEPQGDAVSTSAARPPVQARLPATAQLHAAMVIPRATAPASPPISSPKPVAAAPAAHGVGCQDLEIASVNGDGSQVVASDGSRYDIADPVMRMTASNWATGDAVGVCTSVDGASLKVGYSSVSATAAGVSSVDMGSCRNLYIGYTTADGSKIGATDGSVFEVVPNEVLKMTASNWTTGQPTVVCTALRDGTWYAAIRVGYSKVEATLAKIGTGRTREASCYDSTVERGPNESGGLRIGNGSYRIENTVMQMTAQQLVTGDAVTVCTYSTNGTIYASIAKGYSRVQATQL
jgi:hypothetical protein